MTTVIEIDHGDRVIQCDDCGAFVINQGVIAHFGGCKPGESERWQKSYEEFATDEAAGVYDGIWDDEETA